MNPPVLQAIHTRRVVRRMTGQPVSRDQLETVLKAARVAPSAGNRRLQRFVAVQDSTMLRLLRMVSPGMLPRPTAVILICIDWQRVQRFRLPHRNMGVYIDVGAALQTMLLAAHAIGLGSVPVASFSKAAVRVLLNLPSDVSPEVFVCLGYAAPTDLAPMRRRSEALRWQDLTDWERIP